MKPKNELDTIEKHIPAEYASIKDEVVKGILIKIGTIEQEISSKRNIATKEYNQKIQQLQEINENIKLTDKYTNDLKITIKSVLSNYSTSLKNKYDEIFYKVNNILTQCGNELNKINKQKSRANEAYHEAINQKYTLKLPSKNKLESCRDTAEIISGTIICPLFLFLLILVITFYSQAIYHGYLSYSHELLIITLLTIIGYPLAIFSIPIFEKVQLEHRTGQVVLIILELLFLNSILIALPVYLTNGSDLIKLMKANTSNDFVNTFASKTYLIISWIIEVTAGIIYILSSKLLKLKDALVTQTPSKNKLELYINGTNPIIVIVGIILFLLPLTLVITFYSQAIYHSYISYSHELLIITLLTIIGYPVSLFSILILGEAKREYRAGKVTLIIAGLLLNCILIILPVYLIGWSDLIELMRSNTSNNFVYVITNRTFLSILWAVEIITGVIYIFSSKLLDEKVSLTNQISYIESQLSRYKEAEINTIKNHREQLRLYNDRYLDLEIFFTENTFTGLPLHRSEIELDYTHRLYFMSQIADQYASYNKRCIAILAYDPKGVYDRAILCPDKIATIENESFNQIEIKRKAIISSLEEKVKQILNDKEIKKSQIQDIETLRIAEENKAIQLLIGNYDILSQNLSEHSLLLTPSYVSPTQSRSHVLSGKPDHQLLLEQAKRRYILPYILLGKEWCGNSLVPTGKFLIPIYAPWHSINGSENKNFAIFHNKRTRPNAIELMNNLLLNMLIAFPPKKIQFTFIDLMHSGDIIDFTSKLDNSLYQIINTEPGLRNAIDSLQSEILSLQKRRLSECKNLMEYNVKNSTIIDPYRVIVLLDYPSNMGTSVISSLKPFVENGYKGGIFFIILVNEEMKQNSKLSANIELLSQENFNFIKTTESKEEIEFNNKRILPYYLPELNTTPLISTENKPFLDIYLEALKKETVKKEKPVSLRINGDSLYNTPYQDATIEFKIAIGKRNGEDVYFELNEKDHVHSFILGMSGSGKSVLLHDIISIATLKYSPETLQLYLMDFKMGGVEFNQYKNLKHARAILVDDSDKPITLEILRNLYSEMDKRGKAMSEHGVTEFQEYNNKTSTPQKFPRIILVIDECQELFCERADQVQQEINSIISRIAKEGRSKGVHLLMATQTFSNANIPPELLNNITDPYLLKANTIDSEKLVKDSYRNVNLIKQSGETFYPFKDGGSCLFQPFNAKENLSDNISLAIQKSKSYINNTFYFSGKQTCKIQPEYCPAAINKVIVGKKISLDAKSVEITFRPDDPNLAVIGINERNACRICFSAILSRMCSASVNKKDIFIINCINPEEENNTWIAPIINHLGNNSRCVVIGQSRKKTSELLLHLNATIENDMVSAQNTMLVILGQKRFRDLMNDSLIDAPQKEPQTLPPRLGYGSEARNEVRSSGSKAAVTYKSILKNILKNGPDKGIHTIIQVDRPENLLFDDTFSPKEKAIHFFANQVYLRTAEESSSKSRLPEEIKPKALSSDDPERLRAYFYNAAHSPSSVLFMPFVLPEPDEINKFIKE